MAESRESLTIKLNDLLQILIGKVKSSTKNNLSSSPVIAETTICGLMNLIYDYNLVNVNEISQNYPGIDLFDTKRNIAVQVTATDTIDKVKHTLELVNKSGTTYDLLIILFITNEEPTAAMKKHHKDILIIPDLLRTAKGLSMEKLRKIIAYMEDELGFKPGSPQLNLPPLSGLQPSCFVGRKKELEQINTQFSKGDDLVILTGLGGMGKTELAVQYGREYPHTVYYIQFDTSFTRTLANMAHHIISPKLSETDLRQDEDLLAKKVLDILKLSEEKTLLIIDNVDSETSTLQHLQTDANFTSIRELRRRVLITTRSAADRPFIEIKPMPNEPLFEIFRNHGVELTEAEMDGLIDAVNGHTLTIDLMARILRGNSWRKVSAEKLLTALRENGLRGLKYHKIASDYNQSKALVPIYTHLSIVFDISDISAAGKNVLSCATLLPDGGMDCDSFGNSLQENEQNMLDELLDHGWLEKKDDLITIHPVIRMVCQTTLQPKYADCEDFLLALYQMYTVYDGNPPTTREYIQASACLLKADAYFQEASSTTSPVRCASDWVFCNYDWKTNANDLLYKATREYIASLEASNNAGIPKYTTKWEVKSSQEHQKITNPYDSNVDDGIGNLRSEKPKPHTDDDLRALIKALLNSESRLNRDELEALIYAAQHFPSNDPIFEDLQKLIAQNKG